MVFDSVIPPIEPFIGQKRGSPNGIEPPLPKGRLGLLELNIGSPKNLV